MRIFVTVALLIASLATAHAKPIASAPSALGGWIILEDWNCEAPLNQWHHYSVTRADGMVVSSGCYYLSNDKQKIVAREGVTLTPIEWPADVFHMISPEYQRQLESSSAPQNPHQPPPSPTRGQGRDGDAQVIDVVRQGARFFIMTTAKAPNGMNLCFAVDQDGTPAGKAPYTRGAGYTVYRASGPEIHIPYDAGGAVQRQNLKAALNERCRGGSGDDPKTDAACNVRDMLDAPN